jgi:F-type H+-transporting ATPase subunit c
MRTKKMLFLLAAALMLAASPVFAQGTAGASGVSDTGVKAIAAVIGMAIASGLCGLGQGRAVAGAVEGMARNPGARAGIQFMLLLGLVFIESLAIYTFAIVFART